MNQLIFFIQIKSPKMMKYICLICLICVYFATVDGQNFGNDDITGQLNSANQDYVLKQINCILEKAPCDRTGKQLKLAIPEVIQRNCRSCSKQQAANARKLISFVQKRYPKAWNEINAKYRG